MFFTSGNAVAHINRLARPSERGAPVCNLSHHLSTKKILHQIPAFTRLVPWTTSTCYCSCFCSFLPRQFLSFFVRHDGSNHFVNGFLFGGAFHHQQYHRVRCYHCAQTRLYRSSMSVSHSNRVCIFCGVKRAAINASVIVIPGECFGIGTKGSMCKNSSQTAYGSRSLSISLHPSLISSFAVLFRSQLPTLPFLQRVLLS